MSGIAPRLAPRSAGARAGRGSGAAVGLWLAVVLVGCASPGPVGRGGPRPPRPAAELRVVYPPEGATLTASDSAFVFGSVNPPDARVTVNGLPARSSPSGGWLGYVPVVSGDFVFHVESRAAETRDVLVATERTVRVPGGFDPGWLGLLDSASVAPRDSLEVEPGDPIVVRFKGLPGLQARAVLGEGVAAAMFVEEPPTERNVGKRVFGPPEQGAAPEPRPATRHRAAAWSWYRTQLVVPGPLENSGSRVERPLPASDRRAGVRRRTRGEARVQRDGLRGGGEGPWTYGRSAPLWIEVPAADSSVAYRLPSPVQLRDPAAVEVALLDDDPRRTGRTDGRVVGRTAPDGVYQMFLANGTRAATGRRAGEFVELRLTGERSVWALRSEVQRLPPGTPAPASLVPVVRTRGAGRWTRILVPLDERLPVDVRQEVRPSRYVVTIYGATAATEFMRYDFGDSLVQELRWSQPERGRFVLEVLARSQPWGFRYGFAGSDFYLDLRQPPKLRTGLFRSILKGLAIVVDPGHSPDAGATGPTGYREKDANLAVGLELARELREKGARVVLTRTGEVRAGALTLNDRVNLAARTGADLLVSVHHNALPDGVNPFRSNGTSTYYHHPRSLPLARAIQRELLAALDLPDFGIAHGNLALVRPTEMPAVLTEAAFMMIPEQEALLRTEAFRRREARAIARGIERFLEESRSEDRQPDG